MIELKSTDFKCFGKKLKLNQDGILMVYDDTCFDPTGLKRLIDLYERPWKNDKFKFMTFNSRYFDCNTWFLPISSQPKVFQVSQGGKRIKKPKHDFDFTRLESYNTLTLQI